MIGWTLLAVGALVLMGLVAVSGDVWDRAVGTGARRMTARARVAEQRKEIIDLKERLARYEDPAGFPTTAVVEASDRTDLAPKVRLPAPADQPGYTPAADVLGEDRLLVELVNERTMPLSVAQVREATGNADTAVLPAVTAVVPLSHAPLSRVTWGVKQGDPGHLEHWALGTAPGPFTSATSVPVGVGDRASIKVTTALSEEP